MNIRYVAGEATWVTSLTDGTEIRYITMPMRRLFEAFGGTNMELLWSLAVTPNELEIMNARALRDWQ